MNGLFWLLLPVAAISGWIAATRHYRQQIKHNSSAQGAPSNSSQNTKDICQYFNKFTDAQTDKAVDIVINQVKVTPETVEVHLALGKLYRGSGEVNRAIRFHQNLSEKHALTSNQRESILFELGLDYLAAGLLDRAEQIFQDLLPTPLFGKPSCKALIEIYQQEKDWKLAIEYSLGYESLAKISLNTQIGHYFCEMAILEKQEFKTEKAIQLLNQALAKDKKCVRANIQLADIHYDQREYEAALKFYLAAVDQDRIYLTEIIDRLMACFQLISEQSKLSSILPHAFDNISTVSNNEPPMTNKIDQLTYQKKSIKLLEQHLDKSPSLALLSQYLLLSLDDPNLENRKFIHLIKNYLFSINHKNAAYRCIHCGVAVHALHWQCPSCAEWSSINPI